MASIFYPAAAIPTAGKRRTDHRPAQTSAKTLANWDEVMAYGKLPTYKLPASADCVSVCSSFSFLVAKLFSMAMVGDDVCDSSKNVDFETVTNKVKFEIGLRVQSTESKKGTNFEEIDYREEILKKLELLSL
uniref:Putative GRF zinc finger protein n=1 Tax=Davidia involucrata TaxID=16924 RepID=A0A5B6Z0Z8_DAVIN